MTLFLSRFSSKNWYKRFVTTLLALVGIVIFSSLQLPLPFLLGPMLACLAGGLIGIPMQHMGRAGVFMRTFLGVAVGASITSDLLDNIIGEMLYTLALIPVFVVVIGLVGYMLLRLFRGFDKVTSYYSVMPGGLQDMVIFGDQAGGNVRAISLIQATRVIVIVTIAPLLVSSMWNVDLSVTPGEPLTNVPAFEIFMMVVAGFAGWQIAARLRIFGASIVGPIILTAILSLTGVINQRPPGEIILASQLFVGIAVGVRYSGITLKEVKTYVFSGVMLSIALALISLVFIEVITLLQLAPSLETALSFLPGGQAEMVVIGIIAGADLGFLVTHHMLRLLLVILLAPIVFRFFIKQKG